MSLWAIVPVKALHKSKSRLREVLTSEQRVNLSWEMLLNTLQVLAEVPEIEQTIVVTGRAVPDGLPRQVPVAAIHLQAQVGAGVLDQAAARLQRQQPGVGDRQPEG